MAHWIGALGLGFGIQSGPAPEVLLSPSVMGELALERDELLSPAFSLRLSLGRTGALSPSVADATFQWLSGTLGVCPFRWLCTESLSLRPCATFDLGVLHAEGKAAAVAHPGETTRPWVTAGHSAQLRWHPREWFFVDLSGTVAAVVTRYEFVFLEPRVPVYEVPVAAGSGRLGVGYRFF